MSASTVYGIDLGTTYSCIARVDEHGRPAVVPNAESETTTPSVVYFENESNIVVGRAAKEVVSIYPDQCVATVKRAMGDPHWKREIFGEIYRPQDVSALVLQKVVEDARQVTGDEIRDVVITCPAYFGLNEKEATKQAGEIAGLNVLYVIPEPTAAALAYGMEQEGREEVVLVYDLGGGTFDVTVIKVSGDEITVVCTGGDHELGGKDWDDLIVSHLAQRFSEETGMSSDDVLDDAETYQELLNDAEECKKTLTTREKVPVPVRFAGQRVKVELTRERFEELSAPLLERTLDLTAEVVEKARQKGHERIDRLLLVGGSTYMPQVQEAVAQRFSYEANRYDPNQAVAKGAALFGFKCYLDEQIRIRLADQVGGEAAEIDVETVGEDVLREAHEEVARAHGMPVLGLKGLVDKKVTNVTSKSFGLVVMTEGDREIVDILIKTDEPVPASLTRQYGTYAEGQVQVNLQCMESSLVDDQVELSGCQSLGEAILTFGRPLPKGSQVEVSFDLGADGLLKIHGRDLTSGHDVRDEFRTDAIRSPEELEVAKERHDKLQVA